MYSGFDMMATYSTAAASLNISWEEEVGIHDFLMIFVRPAVQFDLTD